MALRIVNMVSAAVRALLDSGVEDRVRGSNDLASPTALLLLPVLFMVYRKLYAGMVYRNLSSMPAGAGKQGNNWLKGDGEKSKSTSDVEVEVTWLGATELKVLQACGDTLLPGFEIGTKEAADAAVEQVGGSVCGYPSSLVSVSAPCVRTVFFAIPPHSLVVVASSIG